MPHMLYSKQVKMCFQMFSDLHLEDCLFVHMLCIYTLSCTRVEGVCSLLRLSTHLWLWLWPGPCRSPCGSWPHRQKWCWPRRPPSVPSAPCPWSAPCLASLLTYCRDTSIWAWERREGRGPKIKEKKTEDNMIVVCLTLGTMRALRQTCIYRNVLYCAMSSNSTNLDGQCKTNQSPPSSKGNPLSHIGGKYDWARKKIKTAGSSPKISSPFLSPRLSFLFFFFILSQLC